MPEFWNRWVSYITEALKQNHEAVQKLAEKLPTYFVRFEDLRTDPIPVMVEAFKFLLDVPSIEGTVIEKRILDKCGKNIPKSLYKLKSLEQNLNRNIGLYSPELLEQMKTKLKDHLYFFGYINHPLVKHETAFFEFDRHEEADLANFSAFKNLNEKALAALEKTPGSTPEPTFDYHFNTGDFIKDKVFSWPTCFTKLTFADP